MCIRDSAGAGFELLVLGLQRLDLLGQRHVLADQHAQLVGDLIEKIIDFFDVVALSLIHI